MINHVVDEPNTIPVNKYGNVDVRYGVPQGCVHVEGKRLTVTCRAIGIAHARALVGWREGRWGGPVFNGVVIRAEDESCLLEALQRRDARRLTPAQKLERRRKRQEKDAAKFAAEIRAEFPGMPEHDVEACAAHATEIGSGRVGRSRTVDDRAFRAVVAYIRHHYTDYDEYLASGWDWEDAREMVGMRIAQIVDQWSKPAA